MCDCPFRANLAADHLPRDLGDVGLSGRRVLHNMAVAHNDDLVADRHDFVQAVRDEDHGNAARRHAAN